MPVKPILLQGQTLGPGQPANYLTILNYPTLPKSPTSLDYTYFTKSEYIALTSMGTLER